MLPYIAHMSICHFKGSQLFYLLHFKEEISHLSLHVLTNYTENSLEKGHEFPTNNKEQFKSIL